MTLRLVSLKTPNACGPFHMYQVQPYAARAPATVFTDTTLSAETSGGTWNTWYGGTGAEFVCASYVPTQRDRWSGGQHPMRPPASTRSHLRPVGLSLTSPHKTTSMTISTLSTTSEVVRGTATLCHRAKLCVSSPCVFLGLFSFKEGAHG